MWKSRFARVLAGSTLPLLLPTTPADGQETTRISVDSSGAEGDHASTDPAISGNGQFVAFVSGATNLVLGDNNGHADIFVRDLATGIVERVNLDTSGALEADDDSEWPSISADGLVVAFESAATNLVAGDTNARSDVFVHDRTTGVTTRVSVDSSGAEGNGNSLAPAISSDGRIVAFWSVASNLVGGDMNGVGDVFVHDLATGITERVSVSTSSAEGNMDSEDPAISADGRFVAFESRSKTLVSGDWNGSIDIFVRDRAAGTTERVSVDSSGVQANSFSERAKISDDGRFVSFTSFATNLVAGDTNGFGDVFVHDRTTGTTERVSVDSSGAEANELCRESDISADGNFVAFSSYASNLIAGDTNGETDIFVHDRVAGTTGRVSVRTDGGEADQACYDPSISVDGRFVAFESSATNLVNNDTNTTNDDFVHDSCSTLASWSNYGSGFAGTRGVPGFTSRSNPTIGTTITLDLENSYGNPTTGLILVGFQQASIHAGFGGYLLVVPALVIPITFSYGFDSFSGGIPDDHNLCGTVVDLQALESDPGAAKGVSSTRGLELLFGE